MEISSSTSETKLATAKIVLSTAASVAAAAMLARSIAQDVVPHEFQAYLFYRIRNFFGRFSSQLTMVVDEFDGYTYNEVYGAAETYLGSKVSPTTQRLKVSKQEKENEFTVKMDRNEEIVDIFQDVKFKWVLVCTHVDSRKLPQLF
ncbi:hypothetical protein OIU77_003504 [Salix suchowensis]|uniref:AAA-type ATPase N-terminal domain-containing protein n=1 Tax=Salix suchowensis TaxID=1278906 RepID=A0ABQ9B042_9ROSI|nr:hypothetical protein OIU77_003504 [Salix suchowensis]